jgi:hypothetical protein
MQQILDEQANNLRTKFFHESETKIEGVVNEWLKSQKKDVQVKSISMSGQESSVFCLITYTEGNLRGLY